ncbi:MAG: hypothetical protein ACRCV6_01100 [Formosimonas sp.]
MTPDLYIHQIYYNEHSRTQLDAGFIPLDNRHGRPDWYEFAAIRDFLHRETLLEHAYYGFFSPKFTAKTGLTAQQCSEFIHNRHQPDVDAFVISPVWSHTAFFRNVFEQGEFFHKGLWAAATEFFQRAQYNIDLTQLVTHSQNTAFANYIVAKPAFWRQWLALADKLYALAEAAADDYARNLSQLVYYGGRPEAGMKVFLQERLATTLLATQPFKVVAYDTSRGPLNLDLVNNNDYFITDLLACDALKIAYTQSQQPSFLRAYEKRRALIELNFQQMSNP